MLHELSTNYHVVPNLSGSVSKSCRDVHQLPAGNPCLTSLGLNMCWNKLENLKYELNLLYNPSDF